jgi:hypothetical protein
LAGCCAVGNSVKVTLQDENGGNLVDNLAMFAAGAAGGVQMAMSFGGGQTLIPEVDGQAGLPSQNLRKGLSLYGLRAKVPGHVEGISNHDLGAGEPADDPLERFEVLAAVGPNQGEHRLRGQAHGIGDGDPDTAVANVEPEEARGGQGIHTGNLRAGLPETAAAATTKLAKSKKDSIIQSGSGIKNESGSD